MITDFINLAAGMAIIFGLLAISLIGGVQGGLRMTNSFDSTASRVFGGVISFTSIVAGPSAAVVFMKNMDPFSWLIS